MAPGTVVAIIQARMGSSRLPGKVLRRLGGISVLAQVIGRVRSCPGIDTIVVATTRNPADDAIEREAAAQGAAVFRGDEDDVLRRYYEAAQQHGAATVIRVTSDCPLLDSGLLSRMLRRFLAAADGPDRLDYLSNTQQRSFPRGLDAEIFSFGALESAQREAAELHQREHVTPFIWEQPGRFAIGQYREDPDRSGLRWTLDTEADWEFLHAVFGELGRRGLAATTSNVLQLIREQPALAQINAGVEQKPLRS